jgi:hypothetical protein
MRQKEFMVYVKLLAVSATLANCASEQRLAFKAVESKSPSAVTPKKRV